MATNNPYYAASAYFPPPSAPSIGTELTEDMVKEALAIYKSGVPLQRRSGPNGWVDIARPSLATLMAWMAQFKCPSIRAAPPKPRELWKAEYIISGETKLSGDYPSKEVATENWVRSAAFTRAVKFVEVLD